MKMWRVLSSAKLLYRWSKIKPAALCLVHTIIVRQMDRFGPGNILMSHMKINRTSNKWNPNSRNSFLHLPHCTPSKGLDVFSPWNSTDLCLMSFLLRLQSPGNPEEGKAVQEEDGKPTLKPTLCSPWGVLQCSILAKSHLAGIWSIQSHQSWEWCHSSGRHLEMWGSLCGVSVIWDLPGNCWKGPRVLISPHH